MFLFLKITVRKVSTSAFMNVLFSRLIREDDGLGYKPGEILPLLRSAPCHSYSHHRQCIFSPPFKAKQIFSERKEQSCTNRLAKQEIIETLQLIVKFYCLVEHLFKVRAFWGVVLCRLENSYRCFEGSLCLHLQPKNEGLTIFSKVRNIHENLNTWKQFPSEPQNLRNICSFTEF